MTRMDAHFIYIFKFFLEDAFVKNALCMGKRTAHKNRSTEM